MSELSRAATAALSIALCSSCAEVTAKEAKRLVAGGARLLDVRTRYEFDDDHIPGAINIPVGDLEARAAELGARDQQLVVYCHSGLRAQQAVTILRRAGFTGVHNLATMNRWYAPERPPPVF